MKIFLQMKIEICRTCLFFEKLSSQIIAFTITIIANKNKANLFVYYRILKQTSLPKNNKTKALF
jgi:hypothetical protein